MTAPVLSTDNFFIVEGLGQVQFYVKKNMQGSSSSSVILNPSSVAQMKGQEQKQKIKGSVSSLCKIYHLYTKCS
jgi:hypothetical protein